MRKCPNAIALAAKIAAVGGAASMAIVVGGFGWLSNVDDLVTTVVNRSGAPLQATFFANSAYASGNRTTAFDGVPPGGRRRLAHHPYGEVSFEIAARLPSGRAIKAGGPYHGGPVDVAEDGPDGEAVVVVEPNGVRVINVNRRTEALGAAEALRAAGYEPDKIVASPSGDRKALIRVGPSLKADRAWRVILLDNDEYLNFVPTVFEATEVRDLDVYWEQNGDLMIRAASAKVSWAHPWLIAAKGGFHLQRVKVRIGS